MIWAAGWYIILSIITFAAYGVDKRRARLSHWRIKENTLHLLELLGGWPGGFIAQRFFHHKSHKTKYLLVFWAIVALHVAVWAYLIYRWRQ